MTTKIAALVLAVMALHSSAASAQCPSEASPCYKLFYYAYSGGTFCHRYYTGSARFIGTVGAMTNFSQAQVAQHAFNAYSHWYFNTSLTVYMEGAGSDTSGTNARVAVVDNATFSSNWGSAVAGPLAVTQVNGIYYPDGTIKFNRTYFRGDNPTFDWQDCVTESCDPSFAYNDLPAVLTHEMGHWWMLDDVEPPAGITGCDSVTMWHQAINSGTWMRDIEGWDIFAINHLYDSPTGVGPSFNVSPGTTSDTLRWEESDPSGLHSYTVSVSDACWGPHEFVASIADGDPAYTPDGRFYTYVTPAPYARDYHYRLTSSDGLSDAVSARTEGAVATPPTAPMDVSASVTGISGGGASVTLEWSPSVGEVTAYHIYRHWLHLSDCDVENMTPWATLGPTTATTHVDTSPPIGDSLFYRVRAVNTTGGSEPSAEVGVYLSETVAVESGPNARAGIRLMGPNPSSGEVQIAYVIPRAGRVSMGVYDVTGRLVTRLVDEEQAPGAYRVQWSGTRSGRVSGLYFVRLKLDSEQLGRQRSVLVQ